MNKRKYIQEITALQRKYEVKYFPKVKDAIQSKIDEVRDIVKSSGIQAAISFLNKEISNTKLTKIVQDMALQVGLRFAQRQWLELQRQKRAAKPAKSKYIISGIIEDDYYPLLKGGIVKVGKVNSNEGQEGFIQTKGFGFNAEWIQWIKNFLFQFIVEKISFSVFETTKETIFTVLNNAIAGGWGIDKTVQALDDLPLSASQAARIVRTEITRATNAGHSAAAETFPFQQQKEWISAHDLRVRGINPKDHASHIGLDGQVVDYEDVFRDPRNGDELRWPGDPQGLPESTINCRCSHAVTAKLDSRGDLIPKRTSTTVIYPRQRQRQIISI